MILNLQRYDLNLKHNNRLNWFSKTIIKIENYKFNMADSCVQVFSFKQRIEIQIWLPNSGITISN